MLMAILTDDRRRLHASIIRDALRLADLTLDQAAREAEKDPRQFARQIDGTEGSLPTLMKLPDSFFRWLAVRLHQEFGSPDELEAVDRLRVVHKKRMARMGAHKKAQVA